MARDGEETSLPGTVSRCKSDRAPPRLSRGFRNLLLALSTCDDDCASRSGQQCTCGAWEFASLLLKAAADYRAEEGDEDETQ